MHRTSFPSMANYDTSLFLATTTHNIRGRRRVLRPSLVADCRFAAGRTRRDKSDRGTAFTATMGVVRGVHHRTADRRPLALPTRTAGFPDVDQFIFQVAHLSDGGTALLKDHSGFAGSEPHDGVLSVFTQYLSLSACGTNQLTAGTGLQVDVVTRRTHRDAFQRQSVAHFDVNIRAGLNRVTHFQTPRVQNVTFFPVSIVDQSDVC